MGTSGPRPDTRATGLGIVPQPRLSGGPPGSPNNRDVAVRDIPELPDISEAQELPLTGENLLLSYVSRPAAERAVPASACFVRFCEHSDVRN